MQEASDSTPGVAAYRVVVHLPRFWPDRPAPWFEQAEAQFELAAITTERTKFNHTISQLNHRHAAEVEDVITSTPAREPYKTLKSGLMRRLSTSREQRVCQLLMHEEMGDCKLRSFSGTSRASHRKYRTTSSAAYGPAGYRPTFRPYLPASLRAIWTQHHNWRTGSAKSSHSPRLRSSPQLARTPA
jgi:hypothetical protein